MATKEVKEELGGFTIGDISDMMFGGTGLDGGIPELSPKEVQKKLTEDPEEEEEEIVEEEEEEEEEEEVVEEVEEVVEKVEKEVEEKEDDLSDVEGDISDYFMKKFADKVGWELDEEDKFETVEDVIGYLQEIVEKNSQPDYADEEVKKFDEFVRQGGNLRSFYDSIYSGKIDPDKVDINNEENQKSIIRENLRNAGYKEEKITSTIERYEDAGILQDQAEDALELIKEYNQKQEEKLLKEQKKQAEDTSKQQQKFFEDVQLGIKELKTVRGINISEVEKRDLLTYIFKPDSDGITQYQKDYGKNLTKNLIESAYFTKIGDRLIEKVQKKADVDAAKKLRQKIKDSKGKRAVGSRGQEEDQNSVKLSSLSSFFSKQP